ncbi:hypothetical protein [Motiliproteus sp. SC1-56]|uniref:hypothetical protein n=1 Tax=Motiliproteus sp. SC1-56 TaxID=2799565 RepID=UPI001A8ED30B|nr:hypothetical protein [Motiliproteus sp. SC1-56]
MLTKILLTALVIGAAYLFLRHQRLKASPSSGTDRSAPATGEHSPALRRLAAGLLIVFLGLAAAFFAYRWLDDRTLLEIRIVNSVTGEVVRYQAYKGDLEGRRFVTVHGQSVSLADSERMEVQALP